MYAGSTKDSVELEELLIRSGADVAAINSRGRTPFFYCFLKSQFLDRKPDANCDPIELATKFMNNKKVDINGRDLTRNTPLHLACKCGATLCVITMIKAGAKLDAQNDRHNTPVGCAFLKRKVGLCVYLLQEVAPGQKVFVHKNADEPTVLAFVSHEIDHIVEGEVRRVHREGQGRAGEEESFRLRCRCK